MTTVFVFGSNLAGRHGKGAALEARRKWGAVYGEGVGRWNASYAIPTKDHQVRTLPLSIIERHVKTFLDHARENQSDIFQVTKIGCGLAGYQEEQIAPFFKGAPENCNLPEGWKA